MKLEFHPDAEQEFIAAAFRYQSEVPGLGRRFHAEVNAATSMLLQYPHIGSWIEDDLRKLSLEQFPYTLIYAQIKDTIYILAVAHQHREPGYWRARV
jgi:plasmid stabilization system protein ParE